jgi:D-aminopeptidase
MKMKKLFISADIEGTCGIISWPETTKNNVEYALFQKRMTDEVNAACVGAVMGGVQEILVKDAHDSAANILADELPNCACVFRGWGSEPMMMMQGLDESFDGVFLTGYHSGASMGGNPLAHTMSTKLMQVKINGETATEMMISAYAAAMLKVPLLLVTGDARLCETVKKLSPNTLTVVVSKGVGAGSIALHPKKAVKKIKKAAEKAMKLDKESCIVNLPKQFDIQVAYREHNRARFNSFYPGATQLDEHTIGYKCEDYMEALRFFHFCL